MGLSNFFSGGGDKSKTYNIDAVQREALHNALGVYGGVAGKGQAVYGGDRVADFSPGQQEALNLQGWSQYLQPYSGGTTYGQAGQALGETLMGQSGATPYSQESIDALFRSAYEQPAMRTWEKFLQPEIREAYSGPGFWSTARMGAEAQGAENVAQQLGEQYGQLRWGAEQANQNLAENKANRALSAIQPALAYEQLPQQQTLSALQGRAQMYGLASAEQQQAQNEINAAIQQFAEEQRLTDPESLQALMGLLGVAGGSTRSSSVGEGLGFGAAQQGLQSVASGALGSFGK